MATVREDQLDELEAFVAWLGRAAALRAIYPDYVLEDSSDYATAVQEIAARRARVLEMAMELNPSIERRITHCLDEDDDLEGTAIACQRLFLMLDPKSSRSC